MKMSVANCENALQICLYPKTTFCLLYLVILHQNVYVSTNYIPGEIKFVCKGAIMFADIIQTIFNYKTFI
jgi:hypothetical protein